MAGVSAGGVLLPYNDIRLHGGEQPSESVGPFQSNTANEFAAKGKALFNASKVFYCTPLKSGQNYVGVEYQIHSEQYYEWGADHEEQSYTSRCVKFWFRFM